MSKGQGHAEMRARMQNIDPYEFEDFVAELWEDQDWDTTVSQASNDLGVDIIATKSSAIDQKLAIQAKRYSKGNKVGRPKVQQYYSLKEQDTSADAAVVVTTSEFTSDAKVWAHDQNVKLVDGDDLVDLLEKYGRYDLLDEYAPDLDAISEEEEKTNSTVETERSNSETGRSWIPTMLLTSGAWVLGLAMIFYPPVAEISGMATIGALLGFVAWLFLPVTIFMDAHGLHQQNTTYQPNRLTWPLLALCLAVIAAGFYLFRRTVNT